MAKNAANAVMEHLRRMMLAGDKISDGKLLGSFIEDHNEAAFEALVRRHGKMVLGVCRRVLSNPHDAEDAFQSVFLVLVRKANSVVPREMVGNWLYGVALQTAIRVKSMNAKQRGRERQMAALPEPKTAKPCRDDGVDIIDQELSRLPDKYRVVIVLCELEGRTRKEVAGQLGWPEGSVSGRLARGKAMLARRLARRGLVLSCEAVAVLLSQNAASAYVPPALVSATVKAASILATGQTAAISAKIVAITQGVLTSMLLTKLKTGVVVSFVVGVIGVCLGTNFLGGQTLVGSTPQPLERRTIAQANGPVKVEIQSNQEEPKPAELEHRLLQDLIAKLAKRVDVLEVEMETLRKEHKAAGSNRSGNGGNPAGEPQDRKAAKEGNLEATLEKVDVKEGLITVTCLGTLVGGVGDPNVGGIGFFKNNMLLENLPVAKDACVSLAGKEAKLGDLKPQMHVSLQLEAKGRLTVREITANGRPGSQGVRP
ncbi:MAG TPA: sigma-70 family RNA polymerase sigma factor [Gemmataceae bacterium]|jgi:RNA polymerase sigma factor (sigma-70 family)|nr:sigma-70 family RNA polymerase sigma factor [Gemmataceae bacterium]